MRFLSATAALALALLLGASSTASSAGTASTVEYAGLVRTAIDSNAVFPDVAASARAHQIVILQSWKTDLMRQLKAANPSVKVIAYKNLSFVLCDAYSGGPDVPQGVRCPDVNANHPEWFLTDQLGNRLNSSGYPWLWLLDVGNRAYQDTWAQNVIDEAKAEGWDGIFMDDANPTLRYHLDPARVAKYPTDSAWTGATRSMLENVGSKIRSNGLLAIANVCCARDYGTVWKDWLPYLSGAMDETFTKWGNDPSVGYVWDWGAGGWSAQLDEVREAEAQGKYFLGISHSGATDEKAASFGLTTMLLASQGRSTFALAEDYTNETHFPVYDRARRLGAPVAAYYRVGAAYRRQFSAGTVVVNPSLSSVRVDLGAAYVAADGARVTSVTLGPTTGAVLLSEAPPADTGGGGGGGGGGSADLVAPETTITAMPGSTVRSGSASFSFVANEAGARFECRLDGAPFAACTSSVTYTGLSEGTHTFSVRAVDLAGNVDPTPATHAWRARPRKGTASVLLVSGAAQTGRAPTAKVRRVQLRVSGRVLTRVSEAGASHVILYRATRRGWRAFARVQVRGAGRFRVARGFRTSARSLRVRAVATSSGVRVQSRAIVVRVRGR